MAGEWLDAFRERNIHFDVASKTCAVLDDNSRRTDVSDDRRSARNGDTLACVGVAADLAVDCHLSRLDVSDDNAVTFNRQVILQSNVSFDAAFHHKPARAREVATNLNAGADYARDVCHAIALVWLLCRVKFAGETLCSFDDYWRGLGGKVNTPVLRPSPKGTLAPAQCLCGRVVRSPWRCPDDTPAPLLCSGKRVTGNQSLMSGTLLRRLTPLSQVCDRSHV